MKSETGFTCPYCGQPIPVPKCVSTYSDVIKKFGLISQAKLAYEMGNISRNAEFYAVLQYLVEMGIIRKIVDASVVRGKGKRWMKEMMISHSFKIPPTLYEYVTETNQ